MKASEIRKQFFDFFESKAHDILPSAPMVTKDDPTLMFTNAGMNQFKQYFLGHLVNSLTNKGILTSYRQDVPRCPPGNSS